MGIRWLASVLKKKPKFDNSLCGLVQGLLLLFVLGSYNCFCIIKSALTWSSMVACSCSMISLWATDLGPERASPFSVYCGIKVPRKAAINHQTDTASNKNTNGNNAIKIWKETAFQISQYSLGRRRHTTGFGGKQNVNSLKSAGCTVYSGVCGVHSAAQHRSATKVLHNLVHP